MTMATTRAKIRTFLWYAREAEEAARFYASVFPDSRVDRVTAMQSESPSGPPGSVKVVDFTLFGQPFQAMAAGPHHDFNDAISLSVACDDQAELDRYWNALLEGGGKTQACGWLIDRWGVRWQIVPASLDAMVADADSARSRRVSDAMMQMVKLDFAALERAYGG
ncbi:MAG: VOC family protein [Myxococcales bacterium]|nr:VOC family protein [Myxococcales bacterium]